MGAMFVGNLEVLFPVLHKNYNYCNLCNKHVGDIWNQIMHLNDDHNKSFEYIAQWLEKNISG